MHLFLRTLYMLTVMVMTGIMMLMVLLCTPDLHTRLSSGIYRQNDLTYNQFAMQSLDNPGIYVAEVSEDEEGEEEQEEKEREQPVKREVAWDYRGNNTGHLKIHLDYARPQHEPWAGTACMGVRVAFARRRSLPRTALASFPGSGNTWLRYLIQGASGLFTGSVYNDPQLASKGFYGENETPECGCTIVVKTHGYSLGAVPENREKRLKDINRFYGRGLVLIRNPYETLIAYRNFVSAGHLGVAGPDAFRGPAWDRFVRNQVELWKAYTVDWITEGKSVLVIHFEHVLGDPRQQILNILQFLRLRQDTRRIHCVLENLNGAFKRTTPDSIHYRLRDPFTPEQHAIIEEAMKEVDLALMRHSWPHLPMHLYAYRQEKLSTQSPPSPRRSMQHKSSSMQHNAASTQHKMSTHYKPTTRRRQSLEVGGREVKVKEYRGQTTEEKVLKLEPWIKTR